jgi:GTP cyclohydrolase FolE2
MDEAASERKTIGARSSPAACHWSQMAWGSHTGLRLQLSISNRKYDVLPAIGPTNGRYDVSLVLQVKVPLTSLCPCSKEISSYGAHNQRSHVTIRAEVAGALSLEELIRVAEDEASCELWGLLKRPDEKYVTERAYDNPKFVEDLVRDIAVRLDREPRIAAYVLEAENFESIHNHSA